MNKTKIDWADSTWNPVTGCRHNCEYCYAARIANRFNKNLPDKSYFASMNPGLHVLETKIDNTAYPFGFEPTFHTHKLNEYVKKSGRNIFVCSMADLFGKWVPQDWKIEVLEACKNAPQHNYIFLTKDPVGYDIWPTKEHPDFRQGEAYTDNMWLGVTYTGSERLHGHYEDWEIGDRLTTWSNFWYLWRMSDTILPVDAHKFISIEPLRCDICEVEDERDGGSLLRNMLLPDNHTNYFEWIIVGAQSGPGKVIPQRSWVEKLVNLCKEAGIPIFMKSSLHNIWGEPLIQEFPEKLKIN